MVTSAKYVLELLNLNLTFIDGKALKLDCRVAPVKTAAGFVNETLLQS